MDMTRACVNLSLAPYMAPFLIPLIISEKITKVGGVSIIIKKETKKLNFKMPATTIECILVSSLISDMLPLLVCSLKHLNIDCSGK